MLYGEVVSVFVGKFHFCSQLLFCGWTRHDRRVQACWEVDVLVNNDGIGYLQEFLVGLRDYSFIYGLA
jgi:hypothetical protein